MTHRSYEHLKSEATLHFREAINKTVFRRYPIVEEPDSTTFEQYMKGHIHHCSFRIDDPNEILKGEIIYRALTLAKDPENAQLSIHGDTVHSTYAEAIDRILIALQEGNAGIQSRIRQNDELRTIERFKLTGPRFDRVTRIPYPLHQAEMIDNNMKNLSRLARNFAQDQNYGYGFALLFLTYAGLDTNEIKKVLSNKQWLHDHDREIRGRLIRENHPDSESILTALRRHLLAHTENGWEPSLNRDAYNHALDYLRSKNFALPNIERTDESNAFRYTDVTRHPYPIVILEGAMTIAETVADPAYVDPSRAVFVSDTFGGIVTTKVVTAYLKFDADSF